MPLRGRSACALAVPPTPADGLTAAHASGWAVTAAAARPPGGLERGRGLAGSRRLLRYTGRTLSYWSSGGVMIRWLRTRSRDEAATAAPAQEHPEEYERVPCVYCHGRVQTRPLGRSLGPFDQGYRGFLCPWCQGTGWRMVKKDPELRDAPPKATFAASGGSGATPESSGEVSDEWHASETPNAPTAPTAPSAPDGMDGII